MFNNALGGVLTATNGNSAGFNNTGTIGTLTNNGTITSNLSSNGNAILNDGGTINTLINNGIINSTNSGIFNGVGTIGTLDNNHILTGTRWGITNAATIIVLNNVTNGTISGATSGINNSGTIGTLSNSGTISTNNSSSYAVHNSGTIGTLENSHVITASGTSAVAIYNNGSIGSLNNSGAITVSNTSAYALYNTRSIGTINNSGVIAATLSASTAIYNEGSIGTLINSGTITGQGAALYNGGSIGTLSNLSTGATIGTIAGFVDGIYNVNGTITELNNSGTIVGTDYAGIYNYNGTIGSLNNSGLLTGASYGLYDDGTTTITTLNNSGTISGIRGYGIDVGGLSHIGTIVNSGTIIGRDQGIANGGTIGTIINSGTIGVASAGDYAIASGTSAMIGSIINSGAIMGYILNQSTNALNISGGTGSIFGTLTGFDGSVGTITNTLSNVNFSGNLLLNDNVNVGSTYALNNTGVLEVTSPITITGNYTQSAGATLLVGVGNNAVTTGTSSDSGYGALVVSGVASIASGSSVQLTKTGSYGFAVGQRYVVVDAALGSTYHASSLIYGINGATGAVVTGAQVDGTKSDLVLTVASLSATTTTTATTATTGSGTTTTTPPTPTVAPASNGNAVAALNGLAAYTGSSNAALLNLYDAALALTTGTTAQANKAGAQLSPATQTNAIQAAAAPSFSTLDIVGAHVDSLRLAQSGSSGIATGESAPQYGVWGQAFGGHASQDARNQISGYTSNYGGLLMGLDKAINDQWRAGGIFSYSNAAVYGSGDSSGSATHINSYGFFGYAGFTAPRWYANLSAGVSAQHYNETRAVDFTGFSSTASGSFGGAQLIARGEVGYPIAIAGATLTPLASLTYAYLHTNDYTESGGDGAALHIGTAHNSSVKSDMGAKLEQAFSTRYGTLVPSLQLAWRHEYDKSKTTIDSSYAADPTGETGFSTQGASPVSDSALMTLGVTVLRASNLSITAQYQVQAASGYLSQAGTLRLRQLF